MWRLPASAILMLLLRQDVLGNSTSGFHGYQALGQRLWERPQFRSERCQKRLPVLCGFEDQTWSLHTWRCQLQPAPGRPRSSHRSPTPKLDNVNGIANLLLMPMPVVSALLLTILGSLCIHSGIYKSKVSLAYESALNSWSVDLQFTYPPEQWKSHKSEIHPP